MRSRIIMSYTFMSGESGWIVIWGSSQELYVFHTPTDASMPSLHDKF